MIDNNGLIFYTLKEARQRLHVSDPTIRSYIKRGKIKAVMMFNRWYISEQHLNEYIESAIDTATLTAAAHRAANDERTTDNIRVFAVGIYDNDITTDGITVDQLQIIPMDVTDKELQFMQSKNLYVYSMELYAVQILDAIKREGFDANRVPVFTMDDGE